MLTIRAVATSKFEVLEVDSVIAKAVVAITMQTKNVIINIDEEQSLDRATAEQLGKIIEFLLNIEED